MCTPISCAQKSPDFAFSIYPCRRHLTELPRAYRLAHFLLPALKRPYSAAPGSEIVLSKVGQFDEMRGYTGAIRAPYEKLSQWLSNADPEFLASRRAQAELLFRRIGITFAVYGAQEAAERLIPFDILPRLISRSEWVELEKGLSQRVKAINLFLADLYGAGEILKAGVIPQELIYRNPGYRPEMAGRRVPHDIYVHIAGVDVIRTDDDGFYVLEDNARTPSGVSYMLENREVMMRLFPELFAMHRVAPIEDYPDQLLAALRSSAPYSGNSDPTIVLLTPGPYNSSATTIVWLCSFLNNISSRRGASICESE